MGLRAIDVHGQVIASLCQVLRYSVGIGHTQETGFHAYSPAQIRGMQVLSGVVLFKTCSHRSCSL